MKHIVNYIVKIIRKIKVYCSIAGLFIHKGILKKNSISRKMRENKRVIEQCRERLKMLGPNLQNNIGLKEDLDPISFPWELWEVISF